MQHTLTLTLLTVNRCFPNMIGCVDGCHIRISPLKSEHGAYYNFTGVSLKMIVTRTILRIMFLTLTSQSTDFLRKQY